jgi:hypothetical protein
LASSCGGLTPQCSQTDGLGLFFLTHSCRPQYACAPCCPIPKAATKKIPEEFELIATRTYSNFHNILGSRPTQLWTGGGIHFLTPQHISVFEKSDKFSKFDQPSRRFIQFEERLLTDNKGDQSHWSTVSFNNCMLRIPCTLNSSYIQFDGDRIIDIPYDARVRIEKYWDGNTPTVGRILLMQYYNYLGGHVPRTQENS